MSLPEAFNLEKLPDYIMKLNEKLVAIIGCGAVGSRVVEILVGLGAINLTLIDFDPFEDENLLKSSRFYKKGEDDKKNKAVTLAKRINEELGDDYAHGINADICCFGPNAFAKYDVVILALDNYAAKVYFNQIWRQIPENERPLVLFGGTYEDSAQSNALDGKGPCIRCLFDEAWITPLRTSCTGITYRDNTDISEHVKTTCLPSSITASFMAEQFRAYMLGNKDVANKRISYTPHPNFGIGVSKPLSRKSCPDCKNIHPVNNATALKGMDAIHTTVGELLDAVTDKLGNNDFEIAIPVIEFSKVAYNAVIKDDYCRCCGNPIKGLYKHSFKTRYEDLLCDECLAKGNKANEENRNRLIGTSINGITFDNCDAILRNRTLYDIGLRIGGFIEVIERSDGIDILDQTIKSHMFYCENDPTLMDRVTKLEV